ncbi:TPA: tyrosine-type recombinase/integrase [Bacillus cereus]
MIINTDKLRLGQTYTDCDLVVSTKKGKCVCRGGFQDIFMAYLIKYKFLKSRFHGLRHTHATLLLKQSVHPKIVSEQLGHKDVFIILHY